MADPGSLAVGSPRRPAALRALCILALWQCGVHASEFGGSNYVPGFYGDFYMAVLGQAGVYLNNFMGYYHAAGGGDSSDMLLDMPGLIGVTDYRVLGARYALALFPAAMYSNYRTGATAARPGRFTEQAGAGDMYVVPLALSWQGPGWSVLAFQAVVPPSGNYSARRDLNLGRNTWSFDSNVSATWMFDRDTYEISANLGVMANTQNADTDYRTGTEFHFDYLLGYHFSPAWALGVAGSYYAQTASDSGQGVPPFVVDGAFATLGPAGMYTFKTGGGREVTVSVKWLHELGVNNHLSGDYLLVRTIFQF